MRQASILIPGSVGGERQVQLRVVPELAMSSASVGSMPIVLFKVDLTSTKLLTLLTCCKCSFQDTVILIHKNSDFSSAHTAATV